MATWCFDKREARGCCSPAVYSSLFRSITYSFGSICLGSLVQALISMVRGILNYAKSRRDDLGRGNHSSSSSTSISAGGGLVLCVLECVVLLLDEIVQYMNQWAFVFVGIYGYSYWESGKRVMELFRARGWTSLITNSLVNYVLAFTTVIVGILTGMASIGMEVLITNYYNHRMSTNLGYGMVVSPSSSVSYVFGPLPGWRYLAFGYVVQAWWRKRARMVVALMSSFAHLLLLFRIGLVMGVSVCSIMMNVIQGAVNTLIVCWADAPAKLEENHPTETQAMASAWARVFPESSRSFTPYEMTMSV